MNDTLKNIGMLGAMLLIVIVAVSIYQIQEDERTSSDILNQALIKAEQNARKAIESENYSLLAHAHGWGIDGIPGVSLVVHAGCLATISPLVLYNDYGDVAFPESEAAYLERLANYPESTFEYANKYNKVVLAHLRTNKIVDCI
jgi:hypothetical protein